MTVRLRAEAPASTVTKQFNGRLAGLVELKIFELFKHETVHFIKPDKERYLYAIIKSYQDIRIELICKNNSELSIKGTLFRYRKMSVDCQRFLLCLCNRAIELERTQILEC